MVSNIPLLYKNTGCPPYATPRIKNKNLNVDFQTIHAASKKHVSSNNKKCNNLAKTHGYKRMSITCINQMVLICLLSDRNHNNGSNTLIGFISPPGRTSPSGFSPNDETPKKE